MKISEKTNEFINLRLCVTTVYDPAVAAGPSWTLKLPIRFEQEISCSN